MLSPIGSALFFGIMYYALKAHTRRWRLLGTSYAISSNAAVNAQKRLTMVIAIGGGFGYEAYRLVTIAISDDQLVLRLIPPLSFMASPLFLPFEEMKVRRTDW